MRPGKRRAQAITPEGRLKDLKGTVKAHIRSLGEHPSGVIKLQFGFLKHPAARIGQESVQDQCTGGIDESRTSLGDGC